MPRDIQDIRAEIDGLNIQMADCLRRRMELSAEVAAYKMAHGLPISDPAREDAILHDMAERVGGEYGDYARRLFTLLMEMSREHQAACVSETEIPPIFSQSKE